MPSSVSEASASHDIVWWLDPGAEYDVGEASCCPLMRKALDYRNPAIHPNDFLTQLVGYSPMTREYGVVLRDADIAQFMLTSNCPWCGRALPTSLRDRWFDELESLGQADPLSDWNAVPASFLSASWWKERSL